MSHSAENDARAHSSNHAPLLNGALLDPGYCDGCDRERLCEQLDEAIAKWEDRGPTSLTVALLAEAAYAARRYLAATRVIPPGDLDRRPDQRAEADEETPDGR